MGKLTGLFRPPSTYSLAFSFRTTVPDAHIVTGESILSQPLFSVYLLGGRLGVNISASMISDVLDMALNDADWYEVHWNTTEAGVVLEVFHAESGFLLVQRHLGKHSFGVFTTRFGRRENENYFVGCLQDAVINGRSVDLMTPQ